MTLTRKYKPCPRCQSLELTLLPKESHVSIKCLDCKYQCHVHKEEIPTAQELDRQIKTIVLKKCRQKWNDLYEVEQKRIEESSEVEAKIVKTKKSFLGRVKDKIGL